MYALRNIFFRNYKLFQFFLFNFMRNFKRLEMIRQNLIEDEENTDSKILTILKKIIL